MENGLHFGGPHLKLRAESLPEQAVPGLVSRVVFQGGASMENKARCCLGKALRRGTAMPRPAAACARGRAAAGQTHAKGRGASAPRLFFCPAEGAGRKLKDGGSKSMERKKVAILMGSDSDWPTVKGACAELKRLGVPLRGAYPQRPPHPRPRRPSLQKMPGKTGFGVGICAAGMAAHLAGPLRANTTPAGDRYPP